MGIRVVYDYPDNAPRFLHIDTTLPAYFDELRKLNIGDIYQDKEITEEDIIATRLPNVNIAGKITLVYEWNKRWEIPGPVRDYYLPYQDGYIHIRTTYSNVTPVDANNPMYLFDYVSAFNKILETLEFTN